MSPIPSPHRSRPSLLRLYLLALLATTLSPFTLQALAQGVQTTTTTAPVSVPTASPPAIGYQNISYAASSILADGGLYIYGGVIKFDDDPSKPNLGSRQFLRLNLTDSFNTETPPWSPVQSDLNYTMISAVPSRDGTQMILTGNRDNIGPLSHIYDVASGNWTITPTLPGLSSMAGYKRGNVGAALDPQTGLVYMYGGFPYLSFSREISVLDTSSGDASKMDWTLSVNQSLAPALYQPYVSYLPTIKKIVVLGGANYYNITSGLVGGCLPLDTAFLFSHGEKQSSLISSSQDLTGAPMPSPRYQACNTVLKDGRVLLQGGRDPTTFFGDAWILDPATWTWTKQNITGPAQAMTRAGHACEMGPNGQLLIIGGFTKLDGLVSTYVMPSMAVIDTNTWTWKTDYKGAPVDNIWTTVPYVSPNEPEPPTGQGVVSGGMSSGAKAGIGAGVIVALLAAGFVYYWRKKKALAPTAGNNNDLAQANSEAEGGVYGPGPAFGSDSNQNIANGGLESAQAGHESCATRSENLSEKLSPISTGLVSAAATKLPLGVPSTEQPHEQYTERQSKGFKGTPPEMDDAALAAALLQAEDHASHKPKGTPYSSPTTPVTQYQQHHMQSISESYDDKDDMPIKPTQITYVSGPQSVPDSEALIERSSPGVPLHVIHARQVDQDGLYPPLTPARPHVASSSIIVGGPVTYPVHSPDAHGTVQSYHPGNGPRSLSFSAAVNEANARAARMGSTDNTGAGVDMGMTIRSPQLPYRDPQMLKDLDDIARIIQMEQEPKSPHTIVPRVDQWP